MNKNCKEGKVLNPKTGRCVFKNSQVLKKNEIQPGDFDISRKNKVIISCGKLKYINPKTKRCVNYSNPDIQKYIRVGYKLDDNSSYTNIPDTKVVEPPDYKDVIKLISCGKLKYINPKTKRCVNYSNPDIQKYIRMGYTSDPESYKLDDNSSYTNIPDTKVVEPPDYKDVIKLISCGKLKYINPKTKRCVNYSNPDIQKYIRMGYKLEPESHKLSITENKIKFENIKPEKIKTELDTDGDNYVSVKEYLDVAESKGPGEKTTGPNFVSHDQSNLGSLFILSLIKNKKGPISKIGCVPLFILCLQKNTDGIYYTKPDVVRALRSIRTRTPREGPRTRDDQLPRFENSVKINNTLDCLEPAEIKFVSFVILNAPKKIDSAKTTDKMNILTPPNLKKLIQKCENDNKYMVVSDLTLFGSNDFKGLDAHSNVLIFDTRRKTIERFDPHGADEYILKKLINDVEENSDKDILKGIKYLSRAYFNQTMIDKELSTYFNTLLPNYTYNGVNITTPYLGPQIKADEYSGLCVTWSCMYMVLRLLNPELSPSDVTIKMIDGTPKELKNRLLRFNKYIVNTLSEEKENLRIFK